jgi:uncharacterized protein (DUF2147 family)
MASTRATRDEEGTMNAMQTNAHARDWPSAGRQFLWARRAALSLVMGLLLLAIPPATVRAAEPGGAATGRWLTEPKDGIIEVSLNAAGRLEGRIIGGNSPGRLDAKNPDPAARTQVLRGQLILRDMAADGTGRWTGGTIYDPDSGKTYKCNLELLADGSLKVRGYIGFSLLGRSQLWTRYTGTTLDLPSKP